MESLRPLGIFLTVAGIASLTAASKKLPILGQGLFLAGILLIVAHIGARRGWKGFPAVPLALASLAFLVYAVKMARL